LSLTDIEIEITTSMTIEGPGETKKLTVGARKLVDILRALPKDRRLLSHYRTRDFR